MEIALIRIDGKNRVTIPKRIREVADLAEKDCCYIYAFENLVLLRKAEIDNKSVIKSLKLLSGLDSVDK